MNKMIFKLIVLLLFTWLENFKTIHGLELVSCTAIRGTCYDDHFSIEETQILVTDVYIDLPCKINCVESSSCNTYLQVQTTLDQGDISELKKVCFFKQVTSGQTDTFWIRLESLRPDTVYTIEAKLLINLAGNVDSTDYQYSTTTIRTKPQRRIGCYDYPPLGVNLFPGGVKVESSQITFFSYDGPLCSRVFSFDFSEQDVNPLSNRRNTVCLKQNNGTIFNSEDSNNCTFGISKLCPNTKYKIQLDNFDAFIFCTIPEEPEVVAVKLSKECLAQKLYAKLSWNSVQDRVGFKKYVVNLYISNSLTCDSLSNISDKEVSRNQLAGKSVEIISVFDCEARWQIFKDICYFATVEIFNQDNLNSTSYSNYLVVKKETPGVEGTHLISIIFGSVFGVLALLIVMGVVFWLWKKKLWFFSPATPDIESTCSQITLNETKLGKNTNLKFIVDVKISDFLRYVNNRLKFNSDSYEEEFKCLGQDTKKLSRRNNPVKKIEVSFQFNQSEFIENGKSQSFFIKGCNSPKEYIISDSPFIDLTQNLWKIIWENNVSVIVMLTETWKHGEELCSQYWPDANSSIDYGDIHVQNQLQSQYEGFIKRDLAVISGNRNRIIAHFQFTKWPRHGCPDEPAWLFNFISKIWEQLKVLANPGPVFVHCSKDFGRTGCFLVLDKMLQDIKGQKGHLNIYNYSLHIRNAFTSLIFNKVQYVFIYECVRDFMQNQNKEVEEPIYDGISLQSEAYSNKSLSVDSNDTDEPPALPGRNLYLEVVTESNEFDNEPTYGNISLGSKAAYSNKSFSMDLNDTDEPPALPDRKLGLEPTYGNISNKKTILAQRRVRVLPDL